MFRRSSSSRLLLLLVFLSALVYSTSEKDPVMSTDETNRMSWPELVGVPGSEAELTLKRDHPTWRIQIIPDGSIVTMDYRTDRIRIWVDADGTVVRAPTIG